MKDRKRSVQLKFRVNEAEHKQITNKLKKANVSQQEFLLKCALQKKIVNTDGIKELMPELKKQGNNLNQLVKELKKNGYVDYKKDLPNTQKELRELWQSLNQYLQKLN